MKLDYLEIGRNIRHHRLKCNLKQKELAEKVNMSEQHISHIQNGHTQLSLPTLVAISNVLAADYNTLLGETLAGAKDALISQEMEWLLVIMDSMKLRLCIEFCHLTVDYEPLG